jgi:hypothetical protein
MRRNLLLTSVVVAVCGLVAGCAGTVGGEPVAASDVAGTPGTESSATEASGTETSATEASGTESSATEASGTETSATEASGTETSATASSAPAPATTAASATVATTTAATTTTATKKWKLPDLAPNRKKNQFGDIIAGPGEANGIQFTVGGHPDGQLVFVITKLTVDPKCVAGAPKSRRGHFLRIDLAVEPRDVGPESADDWSAGFSDNSWTVYDTKGSAQPGIDTDEARACLHSSDYLPYVDGRLIERGKLVSGAVVLDVAAPKGTAVLDLDTDGGWEFHYG